MLKRLILPAVLVVSLFTNAAYAQNEYIRVAATPTPYAATVGNFYPAAIDTYGSVQCKITDANRNSASVIPVSNATGLNGLAAGGIGWVSIGSDTAETGSTTTVINATAHAARVGDVLYFTTGNATNARVWSAVSAVTTNTITIASALQTAALNGDGFLILRPVPITASNNTTSGASLQVNVDSSFQQSAATGILKSEDAGHTTGDAGVMSLAVRSDSQAATTSTAGDYSQISVNQYGATIGDLDVRYQGNGTAGRSPLRLEDSAFADQETVMMSGGVNNRSQSIFNSTNGDATPFGVGDYGELAISMSPGSQTFANSAIQAEDAAVASATGVVMSGAQRQDTIGGTTFTNTTGDAANVIVDADNRLYINPHGTSNDKLLQACSSAATNTSDTSIIAAVASTRFYVTGYVCYNNSAVASEITFKDGTTAKWKDFLTANTTSGMVARYQFQQPIRGTTNTAFQFAMTTTSTSTICCVDYYTSAS